MTDTLLRLGDVIDDYCPRCKLLLNHAVASMVNGTVVKTVCQTCHSEHPYKNAEVPAKKSASSRGSLLDKVLEKVAPSGAAAEGEDPERAEEAAESPRKKRASNPARYISRHATRPPRGR